jgi:hypothetical protein
MGVVLLANHEHVHEWGTDARTSVRHQQGNPQPISNVAGHIIPYLPYPERHTAVGRHGDNSMWAFSGMAHTPAAVVGNAKNPSSV